MSSYQTGPFDEPRPIPPNAQRTSISGASGHRGSFGGPSPQQQQQVAEEGYFGPQGSPPPGPPVPNSYGPPSPRYPTKAQKEYEAQRYPSPPMSPMSKPLPQQQYPPPAQGYEASPRRQSTPNSSLATYPTSAAPQQGAPYQRRPSQPYVPGQYTPAQYDRRQSLPSAPVQQYQPPPDQLHPAHAYGISQQNAAPMNGRRSPPATTSSQQYWSSNGDYEESYDQRQSNGDRRRSDGLTRPYLDSDRRRVSDHGPMRSHYDEDDHSHRRRRSREDREDRRYDDYDVERERRGSRAHSTGGGGKSKSKKEIEKLKKEAYGRPSYGDSIGWATKNMRKFFSSERS